MIQGVDEEVRPRPRGVLWAGKAERSGHVSRAPILAASLTTALAVLALAACGAGDEAAPCSGAARMCSTIITQGVEVEGETARFALRNDCDREIDVKICFEDARPDADCRERTAVGLDVTITERKDLQFFKDRVKVFARYSEDARRCLFPTTDRITF